MAFGLVPKIWGFALEGALEAVLAEFVDLTKLGCMNWVLIPVSGTQFESLRVPAGYMMKSNPS